ncbi:MAG: S1 RNA-binding domain-containing protein [Nanoarchaeota archaeon]
MFYKKKGMLEEGELVVCIVKKILPHSVFVDIEEYENKEGMIHISEVSPGRIRNLRDFVREGKTIVCKVLRVHEDKGHIDLSLRRVSLPQRKNKEEEYKQEQKAEKLVFGVVNELKMTLKDFYDNIGYHVMEKYGGLNAFFKVVLTNGDKAFSGIKGNKQLIDTLCARIKEKIKLPEVVIEAKLKLMSKDPEGIDRIKSSLEKTMELAKHKKYKLSLSYISAPFYRLRISSDNYKNAEKSLQEVIDGLLGYGKSNNVSVEWERKS